jgi:hypothetical protein
VPALALPAEAASAVLAGLPIEPEHVLALQRSAGNRSLARLVGARRGTAAGVATLMRQPAPGPLLTPQAAANAATATARVYDEDSIRFIKGLAGRAPDATFTATDAEAVAQLKKALGVTAPTGDTGAPFLDLVLRNATTTVSAMRSQLIHLVVDHAGLDVSGALSLVYDPTATAASAVDWSPGGVASIRLGNAGFASYATMVAEIRKQLAVRPPAAAATAVPAAVLNDATRQRDAIAFNAAKLGDRRSILLVQGATGSPTSGRWDVDAVRHIAMRQQALGQAGDGRLDQATFEAVATDLIRQGRHNPALQLIIDYYDLDRSHAFNVFFEPTQLVRPGGSKPDAQTTRPLGTVGTGGVVMIYPAGFAQPFAGLVHTVAHELGHIHQVVQGIASDTVREFLSECIELESKGMPEEAIEPVADIQAMITRSGAPASTGWFNDAITMLTHWRNMTLPEKRTHVARFRQIRTLIVTRIRTASTAQQQQLVPFATVLASADAGV